MDWVRVSRTVERDIFWALVGALLAVVLVRFVLLISTVNPWVLAALLLIGAWTGIFLSHYSQASDDALLDSLRSRTPRLRALSLKAMLWLLGTAAVIGGLTVLTASYEVLGRVAGTILVTSIAAGILWPLSLMIDHQKTMAAGLFAMTSVIVVYCLVIPLIWELDSGSEQILSLSLVIGLMTPLGMAAIRMVCSPRTQVAGRLGVVVYVLAVASFCLGIWYPGGMQQQIGWWETGWWLIVYGGLCVVCLMDARSTWWRDWRWIGVLASVIAFLIVENLEWERRRPAAMPFKSVTFFTSIGCCIAHTNLMRQLPLASGQMWLRIGTMVALGLTAVFLNLELNLAPQRGISFLGRIAGAGGVVAACGTLALIVLSRLNRPGGTSAMDGVRPEELTEITLFCPDCGKKQTIALGSSECVKCGLVIRTTIHRQGNGTRKPAPMA